MLLYDKERNQIKVLIEFKKLEIFNDSNYEHTQYVQAMKSITKELLDYSRNLSEGFPHVRVDFYIVQGHICFGEMTFTTHSGYMRFDPDSFDYELGELWVLPTSE